MTKEQVIELAKQAGFQKFLKPADRPEMICDPAALDLYTKLVRNAALEEAAQKCVASELIDMPTRHEIATVRKCAKAIESLKEPTP